MALITERTAGETGLVKCLILLGRRLAKELAKMRKSRWQVFDFIRRGLTKVGEAKNPHTPYARRRRETARRASGLGHRDGAA